MLLYGTEQPKDSSPKTVAVAAYPLGPRSALAPKGLVRGLAAP